MYNVYLEDITFRPSPDIEVVDAKNIKIMGRDRVINGSCEFKEAIDDNFKVNVTFYTDTAGTGDWKMVVFKIREYSCCAALVDFHTFLEPSLMQGVNTNFPHHGDVCPIPKGTYYFTNITIGSDHWPVQVPRGPAKAIASFTKFDENIGELEIYFKITNIF